MSWYLVVMMPDGSEWKIPVDVIARDRAKHYASEFNGDIDRSLNEDTLPLFESFEFEIEDWASNNMNWEDVKHVATQISAPPSVDYEDGWANGHKRVVGQSVGAREWRWVDHKGRAMTNWSGESPPPLALREVEDEAGRMHVEFREGSK